MDASGAPEGGAGVQVNMHLRTFVCICGNNFLLSEDYARHMSTRHTCLGCPEEHGYKDVWSLRKHLKKIGRPIVACHCSETFKTFPEMRQHEQTGHNCPECQRPAGGLGALRLHIYRSHIDLSAACPHCDMRYAAQRGLTRHISLTHRLEGEADPTAGNVTPTANPGQDGLANLEVLTDRVYDEEVREGPAIAEPQQEVDQGVGPRQGIHFGEETEGVKQAARRTRTITETFEEEELQRAGLTQANLEGQASLEPLEKVAKTSRVNRMPPGISIQSHEKVRSWPLTNLAQNVF